MIKLNISLILQYKMYCYVTDRQSKTFKTITMEQQCACATYRRMIVEKELQCSYVLLYQSCCNTFCPA